MRASSRAGGLTSADLGVAGAALAGRPGAGGPGTAPRTQLLPSAARDAAVLPAAPGTPHPGAGAAGNLLASQRACHAGAGARAGLQKTRPWLVPLRPRLGLAPPPSLPLLRAHQLSQGPATTSPGSRLSQELRADPADRLRFSGIPEGTGMGAGLPRVQRAPQSLLPLSHLLLPSPSVSAPWGPESWTCRWRP